MPTSTYTYHFLLSLFTGFIHLLAGIRLSIGALSPDKFRRMAIPHATAFGTYRSLLTSGHSAYDWPAGISP